MRIRPATGRFLPWLLASALVDWVGTGLFLAVSVLFFVRVVGLSTVAVGAGLTIAALAAMPAVLPVGWLSGRYGPRGVLVVVEVLQGAATAGYLAVHGWWSFLAVSFLVAVTQQAAPPLIQALVGELAAGERRTRILAVHRTVINVGIGAGGLIAGLILGSGMHGAFQVLLVADAVAFVLAAALLCALPGRQGTHIRTAPDRWKALRDRRLLALTGYDALLSLWQPMLNVAFPLWLVTRTDAPVGLVGVLYAVAAGCAILLQYPASVLAATPHRALRGYAAAAVCLAVASLGFAAAPAGSGWVTIAIFAVSIVVLTVGEIVQVGSAWTLSFAISPAADRTAYLAAFSMGRAFSRATGPLLMTGVVLALGKSGWIALAAVFAAAALLPVLAARRHANAGRRFWPVPYRLARCLGISLCSSTRDGSDGGQRTGGRIRHRPGRAHRGGPRGARAAQPGRGVPAPVRAGGAECRPRRGDPADRRADGRDGRPGQPHHGHPDRGGSRADG
jgi:Major Facilitator Superfamily